jgi:folate-binding protein YgfZ
MPSNFLVKSKKIVIKKTQDYFGSLVPWEVENYAQDFQNAEGNGGFFDFSHWSKTALIGPDAQDYLNRMSTINFKNFDKSRAVWGAFLTAKAGVISLGLFEAGEEECTYFVPPPQGRSAEDHIEKFHFSENFTVQDVSDDLSLFGVWKKNADPTFLENLNIYSPKKDSIFPSLYWVKIKREEASAFIDCLTILGLPALGEHLFEFYRVNHGLARWGCEFTEKDIILEAGLEKALSRNKGCYPGQEVVERIFSYGQVNRLLKPLLIEKKKDSELPVLPWEVLGSDGKRLVHVMSCFLDPMDTQKACGLGFVHRSLWESKETWQVHADIEIKIKQ